MIQYRLDMKLSIRLLNLFDPHVQLVEFVFNQVVKVICGCENAIKRAHQEREEGEADEFKGD